MEKFEKTNYFDVTVIHKIFPKHHGNGSLMVDEMYLCFGVFVFSPFLVFQSGCKG